MKNILFTFSIAALIALSGCNSDSSTDTTTEVAQTPEAVTFSYSGETGPDNWYKLSDDWKTCENGLTLKPVEAGTKHQSPVDLYSSAISPQDFTLDYDKDLEFKLINNGHTIEMVEESPEKDSFIIIDGKKYKLLQFHFHAHSEHEEETNPADMEMHFVHQAEDGSYAVLGIFIDAADTSNTGLAKVFTDKLPAEEVEETDAKTYSINVSEILPEDHTTANVYRYNGSFTTPPCTEGVDWNIFEEHIKLDTNKVDEFKTLYPNNYRPITGDFK